MATVDVSNGLNGGTHPSRAIRKEPYKIEIDVDFANVASVKGTALVHSDVIQIIDVPAKTMVWAAGLEVVTPPDGDASADIGITAVDPDAFVDGYSLDGASTGDMTNLPAAYQPQVVASDDTIDMLIVANSSAAPTSGVVRVWAVMQDVSNDLGPDEVDRDQLA
tara:strand:+ start:85 stop:576 length:492 start_codon:yes stop_codon:yes gene_type:complete